MPQSTIPDHSVQMCASKQGPWSCLRGATALFPSAIFFFPSLAKTNCVFTGCLHHFFQEQQPPSPFLRHHQPLLMFLLPFNTCELPTPFRDAEKSNVTPSTLPFHYWKWPRNLYFPHKNSLQKNFLLRVSKHLKKKYFIFFRPPPFMEERGVQMKNFSSLYWTPGSGREQAVREAVCVCLQGKEGEKQEEGDKWAKVKIKPFYVILL